MPELNEQEIFRRNSMEELRKIGIEPYPADEYPINTDTATILEQFNPELKNFQEVSLAGRLMSRRIMGSASFAELQDEKGRIQLYLKRDDLCPGEDKNSYNLVFKKLLDIGDIIGVKGFVFITQMGEISIHVTELKLLSKSLRVLPIVKEKDGKIFDAFTDPEQRYRQRYVDLIVNPQVKETFKKRTLLINTMR
ncbi:MAG: OB-fold nucleic acid binding domain-containing protein, partial [Bacteroidales bacterium]|nr:OB-fold nucleic acid binding domain-containing protein [Bacteroidales bacterium]